MLPVAQALIRELDAEAPATRRLLERIPHDRLDWRPHPKSFSLGQLAEHVASIPGRISRVLAADGMDVGARKADYEPCASRAAALATLEESVAAAREFLAGLDQEHAEGAWRMTNGEQVLFSAPRLAVARNMLFNHWYHHRGELVVYLRLLDVPVPVVYGRSADEGPGHPPKS